VPRKANTPPENSQRRGGAKPGHRGHGRRDIPDAEVTREESVPGLEQCPYCGGPLDPKGSKPRTIIEVDPVRKEVIRYELAQRDCGRCHRTFTARPAGVFAKGLFGNQLLTHLAVEHYVQGVTLGHLSAQLAVGQGGLWAALHQLARRLAEVPQRLLLEYRRAPVKHADETGWRNDGHNGYAWLFCTPRISLFRFRQTRSASVAKEVFGTKRLPGTLVVDRYNGYNRAPCSIQYCYAHLLREVQDLGKEFPEVGEVSQFVGSFAPLLAGAMKLRARELRATQFKGWCKHRRSTPAFRKSKTYSARKPLGSITGPKTQPFPLTTTAPSANCVLWSSPVRSALVLSRNTVLRPAKSS
jgi:transposase